MKLYRFPTADITNDQPTTFANIEDMGDYDAAPVSIIGDGQSYRYVIMSDLSDALTVDAALRAIQNADYTLDLIVETGNGDVDITITQNGGASQTFTVTPAQYNADAHNLIAPDVTGVASVGESLTAVPGVFLVDPDLNLTTTYQWQRDGVDISGATVSTYTTVAGDVDTDIRVVETLGPASVASPALSIVGAIVSLIDLTVAPDDDANRTSGEAITNGWRLTQTAVGSPQVEWLVSENLVNGTTYRLQGTITISDGLDENGRVWLASATNSGGAIQVDQTLTVGSLSYPIDVTFTCDNTRAYHLYISVDQYGAADTVDPANPRTVDLTGFILEQL